MNIRPLPQTPHLRLDLARRDWLQFAACPGRQGRCVPELELCARAVAKFDPKLKRMGKLKRTGKSSWGTGKCVERQPAPKLRELGVFAGIGGFSLGLQMTGHFEPAGFIEIEPFCQKVLAKNFKGVPIYGDIKNVTNEQLIRLGRIDILTAGFPCQPFSKSGNRQGIHDERFLWPDLYRVIATVRPRYCLLENSDELVTIQNGVPFGGILLDLARLGYAVEWGVIPAVAAGAAHIRERLWIVAYPHSHRQYESRTEEFSHDPKRYIKVSEAKYQAAKLRQVGSNGQILVNSNGARCEGFDTSAEPGSAEQLTRRHVKAGQGGLSESTVRRVLNGFPARLDKYRLTPVAFQGQTQFNYEPPRVIDDKLPHHAARIKVLGNAVVPQIVAAIGECVWAHHVAHLDHQPAPSGGERVSGVEELFKSAGDDTIVLR